MHLRPWPKKVIPKLRPADWGFNVTICISALSTTAKELVMVSDSKIAFGDFSADDAVVKNIPFYYPWAVMLAGDDISHAKPVLDRARELTEKLDRKRNGISGVQIAGILHGELVREREKIIEASVLRRFKFSAATFRNKGKSLCSESMYNDLIFQIAGKDISLEFLLCGFTNEAPEIWGVTVNEPPQNYDNLGFWCIGSGANRAMSSLAHSVEVLHLSRHFPSSLILYHLLAAKFMAQSAKYVGESTFVVISPQKGNLRFMNNAGVEKIRTIWETEGAPKVPNNIQTMIEGVLFSPSGQEEDGGAKQLAKQ